MNDRMDQWAELETRGSTRGADAVFRAAIDAPTQADDTATSDYHVREAHQRRRTPAPIIAFAAAFALVLAGGGLMLLIPRSTPEASLDVATTTASTTPAPDDAATTTVAALPLPDLPPLSSTESPAVDSIVALPRCSNAEAVRDSQLSEPADRLGVALAGAPVVDLAVVANLMPVPRAGSYSLVSPEVLSGACTVAVMSDEIAGWVLVDDGDAPVMGALSRPWPDNSVPDMVFSAPGDYQQSVIATGQSFTGPIDTDGSFHVMTMARTANGDDIDVASRMMAGFVDTDLLPNDALLAGWAMTSLAMPVIDVHLADGDDRRAGHVPTNAPEGFGICAAVSMFQVTARLESPAEEGSTTILCDGAGHEITIAAPPLDDTSGEPSLTVNGHDVAEEIDGGSRTLYLDNGRPSFPAESRVAINAPIDVDRDVVLAVIASMPFASPEPAPAADLVANVGVGDGLDLSEYDPTEEVRIELPELEPDSDETTADRVLAGAYLDTGQLSDSMRHIMDEGLSGFDVRPLTYRFYDDGSHEWDHEAASFDAPQIDAVVSVLQQRLPAPEYEASPTISPVEVTDGGWILSHRIQATPTGVDVRGLELIQIVAYAPSIERQVNVNFSPRYFDPPEAKAIGVDLDEAQTIVRGILSAIAAED